MKVHLVKKQTIEVFAVLNPPARNPLKYWLTLLKGADIKTPADIVRIFGSADLLGKGCDRVVFDIGGNNYRMICHYVFGQQEMHLFICWMGSHAAYTRLCKENKQYTVSDY